MSWLTLNSCIILFGLFKNIFFIFHYPTMGPEVPVSVWHGCTYRLPIKLVITEGPLTPSRFKKWKVVGSNPGSLNSFHFGCNVINKLELNQHFLLEGKL